MFCGKKETLGLKSLPSFSAREDSNYFFQESFEDNLDCTWNIHTVMPRIIIKLLFMLHNKFPTCWRPFSLWFPAFLKCGWLTVISLHQWEGCSNSWDVLNSQWHSLAKNKCAVAPRMAASLRILALLSFSALTAAHAQVHWRLLGPVRFWGEAGERSSLKSTNSRIDRSEVTDDKQELCMSWHQGWDQEIFLEKKSWIS